MKAIRGLSLWLAVALWLAIPASGVELQQALRHLRIGEPVNESGNLVVPLEIDDFSGVVAADLDLIFDSAQVQVSAVRPAALLEGFSLFSNTIGDTLKISFAGFQPGAGGGTLLEIAIEADGAPPRFVFSAIVLSAADGSTIPVEYEIPTAVEQETGRHGNTGLRLSFPNPFNGQTTLRFELAEPGQVKLAIYNQAGQVMRVLVEEMLEAGEHQVVWDGRDGSGVPVAGGVYFYRLEAGEHHSVQKMIFAK